MTILCVACGLPIVNVRRQKTCGELCSREWQRVYHQRYHQEHLEVRRESCRRSWAAYKEKNPDKVKSRYRKPLTAEQMERRRELARLRRATPENQAKERAKRAAWTSEQKESARKQKRKSYAAHATLNKAKRRERRLRNPERHREYTAKYVRRGQVAYEVLKQLGISIDLETLEPQC